MHAQGAPSTAAGLHDQSEDSPQTEFLKFFLSANETFVTFVTRPCRGRYFTLNLHLVSAYPMLKFWWIEFSKQQFSWFSVEQPV